MDLCYQITEEGKGCQHLLLFKIGLDVWFMLIAVYARDKVNLCVVVPSWTLHDMWR